jgi:hypothetical protein
MQKIFHVGKTAMAQAKSAKIKKLEEQLKKTKIMCKELEKKIIATQKEEAQKQVKQKGKAKPAVRKIKGKSKSKNVAK